MLVALVPLPNTSSWHGA